MSTGEKGHDLFTSRNYSQSPIRDYCHSARVLPSYTNIAVDNPPTATDEANQEPDENKHDPQSANVAVPTTQTPPNSRLQNPPLR